MFETQRLYWKDSTSLSFNQQQEVTGNLKAKLDSIRSECRAGMSAAHRLAEKFGDGAVCEDPWKDLFSYMKKISLDCSEKMAEFAGQIIQESKKILCTDEPPCDFVAVGIGSLARGEATPYSDLEYLFLVDNKSPSTVDFFERLAVTSYFQIGNLGETKLAYMAIEELEGWFEDKAMNGFKIDGLSDMAGNIPTGNGSLTCQRNHFIVTVEELAEKYQKVLDNPEREKALRGDMTSMLTYLKPIFMHNTNNRDLLRKLKDRIKDCRPNQERQAINSEMLNTDVAKFDFKPSKDLVEKGFAADVKREIYRFPSILLLDIAIVTKSAGENSWDTLKVLGRDNRISAQLQSALEILLAAATYMRLSVYLYHDSQDDRMSVSQDIKQSPNTSDSQRRWFVPSGQ